MYKLSHILKTVIEWSKNLGHKIQRLFCKRKNSELNSNTHFYSLSPTDQINRGQYYFDALNWALSNGKIRNIALTGTYGSGKSSVLQSFQKQNVNKNYHFLDISLATFKEEKDKEEDKPIDEDLQRLIELSILQQLFYKEKDQKLPDSRLKKITNFSFIKLFSLAFGCVVLTLSLVLLFNSDILSSIFPNIEISETTKFFIHYISLICSIVGIFFIALKSVRLLHSLKINKLNINNATIEISPEINKSVLNHNLEEILYFFEVTNYNIVIIEDLDRFKETEIFTKLREVNLLINNSKKIKRRITFIYAVRDDMFADKDRTKFFDFIIPIIPVINSSNSNNILQTEIKTIADKVSETLIDDISLFIDEMRLLYNIINEFQIYKQLLSNKLSQDKLLAMIVYKNIYPCDFVKLSNYEGDLYNTINSKHEYIKQQFEEIDEEIVEYKKEIKRLGELGIKDIKELRSLYILQYVKQIVKENNSYGVTHFVFNNQKYSLDQVIENDIFPFFINSDTVYYRWNNNGNYSLQATFQNVEKQVDSEYTYEEREQQIEDWNNDKIQELKQKISLLEQQKNELRSQKIGFLLSNKDIAVENKDNKQKLINLLLRNGYIDEDYLDYISLFHEGSLSKNDHIFLLNVKSQTDTDFNHNLDKIENLIRKIHIDDFKKEYILNYKLIDFVLTNKGYEKQKDAIFNILKEETDKTVKFIDGFVDNGNRPDLLIKELYHYQINVFDFMYRANAIIDNRLAQYLKLIIENADVADIKETSKESFLPVVISDNPNKNYEFFDLIYDETKIKEVLKALDVKFKYDFTNQNISKNILDYICDNNYYIIRDDLLKIVIKAKGNFNQVDFDTRNYYVIINSNYSNLIDYVEANINDYIANVYLRLETNTKEDEECLVKLLNSKNITEKEKTAIIQKVETKVSTLSKINSVEVKTLLLENSKLIPNWTDIINQFVSDEKNISNPVLSFINNIENAQELSKQKIETENPNKETVSNFLRTLLLENNITDNSYSNILKSIPYIYSSLAFENLSYEKVEFLIKNSILELNNDNYTLLRDNFGLHIDLIEKRYYKLTDELLKDLIFDNDDIVSVLESKIIPNKNKQSIFDCYDEKEIVNSAEILETLQAMVQNDYVTVSKNVLIAILTKTKNIDKRIELYIKKSNELTKDDITAFLQSLSEPYSIIAIKGKRPLIPNSKKNEQFVELLEVKSYISKWDIEKKGLRISTFLK